MVKKPKLFIALCTLPALILTIVFMIVPMLNAIYLSFTSSTALSVGFNSKFVFLDNYIYMFKDKDFVQALFNTFKLMLVIPALTIFLSLVFAFILTQGELREKSFYRYTGTVERKILLPYGILFSKCCLYDRCRNRVVFCI